jgi:hypothetical protein
MKSLVCRLGLTTIVVVASIGAATVAESDTMVPMAGHMLMTAIRAAGAEDATKAQAVVERAKVAMEPFKDYRKALADGYQIFLPQVPQPQYHFTKYEYGRELAASSIHMCLGGWCMCIPMRGTPPRFGRPAMTMTGTTTWITRPCRG